uniref:Uncharacterized protein n=1 Tax=Panagrolaimus sp. ES5 TaxID=591445 RepID=A0AC34FCZ3_9BILA
MLSARLTLSIVATIFLYAAVAEAVPQRCEETTIQYNTVWRNFSLTISADLKLSTSNSSITVTNIQASFVNLTNSDIEGDIKNICAFARVGSVNICNQKYNDPITINVGDSNVVELTVSVTFNGSNWMEQDGAQPFYSSIVDSKSFSFYDGRFYDDNNTCYEYLYDENNVAFNLTECCTSMKPINITTPSTNACTHFTSTSAITYDSNHSIYASVNIDYELQNSNLTMVGKFSNLKNYQPYVVINDAAGCDEVLNNTIYCGYPLSQNGNKLLIFLIENIDANISLNYQVYGLTNRLIFRDNQTFMNDNTAFTPANSCQTLNNTYDSLRGLSILTTSCCSMFMPDPTTTVPPISSTTMGSTSTKSATAPDSPPTTSNTQTMSSSLSSSSPLPSSSPIPPATTSASTLNAHFNLVLTFLDMITSFLMIKV